MTQALEDSRPRRLHRAGGRVPPHNLEAEESVLGAMLLSRDAIADALEHCGAEDFYKPAHGHIFSAITSLYARGEPADPVTVADELRRNGQLEMVGDASVLVSLQVNTPSTANAGYYARIVEEHALLRRLVAVAGEIAELGYSVPEDVSDAVDRAEAMIFEVAQRRVVDTMSPLRELLAASLDHLEHLYERGDTVTGVPTGYVDLDERLAGLQPSNLVVVGARPAMGKTSFALGIVGHAAMKTGKPVLLFSLEMSHLELTQRLLCSEARVDATRMRNGRLLESDWPKISDAIGRLGDAPIFIDDNPNVTVMDIRAKARRLMAREGLGLVVVDYLQLMTGHGKRSGESRQVEVSEISRGLKVLARELNVPVLALSQLSRNLEMRQDKRPVLADLRESGCLTADTRITRADTGAEVTLGELLRRGERDVAVWALDEHLRVVPATMSRVFASGVKRVFELRLASGRRVQASANHPFRTLEGWRRLDELAVGDRLATPRAVPAPLRCRPMPDCEVELLAYLLGAGVLGGNRRPVELTSADDRVIDAVTRAAAAWGLPARRSKTGRWTTVVLSPARTGRHRHDALRAWLDELGLLGLRRADLFVPGPVWSLPDEQLAAFLRHLWAAAGAVGWPGATAHVRCSFASASRRLVEDVQALLLRFGVVSRVRTVGADAFQPMHHLYVSGAEQQLRFLERVGVAGSRRALAEQAAAYLQGIVPGGDRHAVARAHLAGGVSAWAEFGGRSDVPSVPVAGRLASTAPVLVRHGPAHRSGYAPSSRPGTVAREALAELAAAEVWWDEVVGIEELGDAPVYDATVDVHHNFLANGVVAHNSIEQDADVVLFIYRDEVYNPDSSERGTAEIIVAKHRNGPTGVVQLAFVDHYTRFANMARV